MSSFVSLLLALIALSLLAALYFLPAVIAYRRGHKKRQAILVLNLLAGWTFLGWVGAAVWAFMDAEEEAERRGFAWLLFVPVAPVLSVMLVFVGAYGTLDPCTIVERQLDHSSPDPDPETAQILGETLEASEARSEEMASIIQESITRAALEDATAVDCTVHLLGLDG